MIVGKNSAKLGFSWWGMSIVKLLVSIATISYIGTELVIGIFGIIALILFAWEQTKKFKELSKGKE